jgi:hypothetical protein
LKLTCSENKENRDTCKTEYQAKFVVEEEEDS